MGNLGPPKKNKRYRSLAMMQLVVHGNFKRLQGTLILQESYQLYLIRKNTGSCGSPLRLQILQSGSLAHMLGSISVIKILLMDLERPYQVPHPITSMSYVTVLLQGFIQQVFKSNRYIKRLDFCQNLPHLYNLDRTHE